MYGRGGGTGVWGGGGRGLGGGVGGGWGGGGRGLGGGPKRPPMRSAMSGSQCRSR